MAAMESELAQADDRLARAARWLRGLMILAAVTIVAANVHYVISTAYDFDDPNEGNPWDLEVWEWALLSLPVVLPLIVAALLITAGAKRLGALRSGEKRAQSAVNSLAFVSALGSGLLAAYMYSMFGIAEGGFGIRNHSLNLVVEDLTNGRLNPVGWMGALAFVALVLLFVGALVVAGLTRPLREDRD